MGWYARGGGGGAVIGCTSGGGGFGTKREKSSRRYSVSGAPFGMVERDGQAEVVGRCGRGCGDGGVVRWTTWGGERVWAQINQTEPLWLGRGLGLGCKWTCGAL